MPNFLYRHMAAYRLLVRAIMVYVLLRIALAFLGQVAHNGPGLPLDNPVGIVLLMALLGIIDIRVRQERLFWANLGYSMWNIGALFALVATAGECLVALWPH
jgi:hypothetical protein